ncbi:pyruvate, phosphate dikinase [Streptosporangium sp. NPDC048047]|uniref:pyruvate, phosphate dikinase n=1 Tax=Streptosporangium sp. NPDC048047 TaxID=3155748 RepID=UPI00342BC407
MTRRHGRPPTRWIRPLSPDAGETADVIGGKAYGLVLLRRLGLPVPPGFVIGTDACRAFLRDGRPPDGLGDELAAAVATLEEATGRRLGGPERPLAVSVRSGGRESMPGMMTTILNLGLTAAATTALAAETGDARFALDARLRFLYGFATATTDLTAETLDTVVGEATGRGSGGVFAGEATGRGSGAAADEAARHGVDGPGDAPARLSRAIHEVETLIARRAGRSVPDDAAEQLGQAVAAVFSSWETPRATTYRELHAIPHDLGTAVVVQAMVFGNRDGRSGTGVAFSHDPNTGEPVPFGEVLFGRQGEDVVSGRSSTLPLRDLADREPVVWAALLDALDRVEAHYRDACYLEFTFEAGELWLLQARPGRFTGAAAVRLATGLADEGVIGRHEALLRVSPHHLRHAGAVRLTTAGEAGLLARGLGACPGVAAGRVAATADSAVRMAVEGPVILVRPETSPLDMHGIAAAAGIVTARGGPASHAAIVARAMGKPAVVGVAGLTVTGGSVRAGGRVLPEGTLISIDGTGGEVVLGSPPLTASAADPHLRRLLEWADEASGDASDRPAPQRLAAAHAALGRRP